MSDRVISSEYMHWAKTCTGARFNLASSDLLHYPLAGLPVSLGELEINGPGGYGYAPLLEAIAEHSRVQPGCVVTSFGTSMANHLAMAALIQPGDEVLIEHPTYELIESTAGYLGARLKHFSRRFENKFALDVHEIRNAVSSNTRLIIITNLHNPGSALTAEDTLAQIGEIAASAGATVLVDEVYLDAVFDRPQLSAVHLGPNFVTTNSLTKVYGLSGLRCGWILAQPSLAEKMWRLADLFYSSPVHMAESISVTVFKNLHTLQNRTRNLLEANGRIINQFYESRSDLSFIPHEQGLVAFPRLRGVDVEKLCAHLRSEYDTIVVPGRFFGMPEHIRIGVGRETDILSEGLRRLSSALDDLGGR